MDRSEHVEEFTVLPPASRLCIVLDNAGEDSERAAGVLLEAPLEVVAVVGVAPWGLALELEMNLMVLDGFTGAASVRIGSMRSGRGGWAGLACVVAAGVLLQSLERSLDFGVLTDCTPI